ncbi:MAG: PaaI family thioesterase [Pseudomonadota bacterium]
MPEPRYPERPEDLLQPQQMAQLTGMDYIRGMLTGRLPAAPIAQPGCITMTDAHEGRVVFEGNPDFSLYNPQGAVHGGWFGIALDSAMGCAVMTRLPRGFGYTTLEYKINILRPVFEHTEPLQVIGESVHAGRRTATADGRIIGSDGKIYATGSTTCLVLELPKE